MARSQGKAMTADQLKKYFKSLKFGGSVVDNTMEEIVDAAAEAAFGKVWEAHVWKVGRLQDDSLRTTANLAYTILPKGFSGIKTLVLIDGTLSRKINIVDEDNFEYDNPYPQAWSAQKPVLAKLAYHGAAASDNWRLYWSPVPDAAYSLRLVYRVERDLSFLPNVPAYMLEAIMLAGSALILPPGATQFQQFGVAEASIKSAIQSDTAFVGAPELIGTDPGFNDWETNTRMRGGNLDWPFG